MTDAIEPIIDGYDFEGRRQHAYNKIEWHTPKDKRGKFLDIGCGPGNGVIAAIQHGFSMAVGIDRDANEFPDFKLGFNEVCRHYSVSADRGILIEADIFKTSFTPASFDCVLLLDSIEHVSNPEAFVN
jgi:2-polyprenyl-3-methyl-5-hydroxy-6-metoxy-1,4-benzoquinol methylase